MKRVFLPIICSLLITVSFAQKAFADIVFHDGYRFYIKDLDFVDNRQCQVTLKGTIKRGDLRKLKSAFEGRRIQPMPESNSLCMSAYGGSYAEAFLIAKYVYSSGIIPYIRSGSFCTGPCALIFIAGTAFPAEALVFPRYYMHVNGTLTFGYSDISEGAVSGTINNVYAEGVDTASKLLELYTKDNRDSFSANLAKLMGRILSLAPGETFSLTTVGEAKLWDVKLIAPSGHELNIENFSNDFPINRLR